MKSIIKPLLLSVALATAGMATIAQTPSTGAATMAHAGAKEQGRMGPSRMQQKIAERMVELKAKLQLNGAQEDAWTQYLAAMQPSTDTGLRMGRENRKQMHEEWKTMTTPQRIERMNAMTAQRDAHMRKRNEATLAFYQTLSPDQQQVFDANAMGAGQHGRRGEHGGKHRHHG